MLRLRPLADWESTSNGGADESANPCIPDCRIRIPKSEHTAIYARVKAGDSQAAGGCWMKADSFMLIIERVQAGVLSVATEATKMMTLVTTLKEPAMRPRAGAGRPSKISATVAPINGLIPDVLGDTPDKKKKTSSRTQQLAKVPWEEIERRVDEQTVKNEKANLGRIVKTLVRQQTTAALDDVTAIHECKAQTAAVLEYHKGTSVEEYNAALKIKARVEHRLGEVLAETVKRGGDRKSKCQSSTLIPPELGDERQRRDVSRRLKPITSSSTMRLTTWSSWSNCSSVGGSRMLPRAASCSRRPPRRCPQRAGRLLAADALTPPRPCLR